MLKFVRVFACLLALSLASTPAVAAVTVTFYAHGGNEIRGDMLLFPHAYVVLTGTLEATGESVDQAVGFTARDPGPQLLLFSGPGVVATPDERYRSEGRSYLSLEISDAVYGAVQTLVAHWSSPEGSIYNLRRRNCISFVAEIARTIGLRTAAERTLSPNKFLTETAALNPDASASIALAEASAGDPGQPSSSAAATERRP